MSLNLLDITTTDLIKYIAEAGYGPHNSYWTAYHREDWTIGKFSNLKTIFHCTYDSPIGIEFENQIAMKTKCLHNGLPTQA